jgi:peptidyl-prolyl cis-trans isomerase D
MLSGMRKGLGRFGAIAILVVLAFAIGIFGIQDVLQGRVSDSIATVNKEKISAREYQAGFDRAVKRMQERAQQQGQVFTAEDARKNGMDRAFLDEMMADTALAQAATKLGLTISDVAIAKEIREIPAFQNGLGGFDKTAFERAIGDAGYNRESFTRELRQDLVKSQLGIAAGSGAQAPVSFIVQELKLRSESRNFRYVKVPSSAIPSPAVPTEAEIKTFYDDQGGQLYAVPEFRTATLALLRPQDFVTKAEVPADQVTKLLEDNRARLSAPEKRTFQQLPVASQAVAQQIAERARKGEKLNAIASALKIDAPLNFADKAKTEIGDSKVAEAVFAAKQGDVVGPVIGTLGAASVVVVERITPAAPLNEAKARQQIRDELAEEQAKDLLFKALETIEDSVSGGATLEKAAEAAGIPAMTYEPIDRQGLTARREPIEALVPEKVRAALFATAQGQQADADSLDDGTYFIVRTDKVKPADKLPFDQVKADVTKRLLIQKRVAQIEKAANDFAALAQSKGGLDKAAAEKGYKVIAPAKALRRGESDAAISPQMAQIIFSGALKQTVVGPSPEGGFIAAEIETITREDPRSRPELLAQIQASTVGQFGNEIANAYQMAVMARSKLAVDQKQFDQINGRGDDQE